MRELNIDEIQVVSGGLTFTGSVELGSAIGGVGYGGLVMAAGYSAPIVASAFAVGVGVGGVIGGEFYIVYKGTTVLGELGGMAGSELARLTH